MCDEVINISIVVFTPLSAPPLERVTYHTHVPLLMYADGSHLRQF